MHVRRLRSVIIPTKIYCPWNLWSIFILARRSTTACMIVQNETILRKLKQFKVRQRLTLSLIEISPLGVNDSWLSFNPLSLGTYIDANSSRFHVKDWQFYIFMLWGTHISFVIVINMLIFLSKLVSKASSWCQTLSF